MLPKIKVFLWLTTREGLPTCEFLITRRLEITNCVIFVISLVKILTTFLNLVLLSKELEIVLNITVRLLSFMNVILFPVLNWFIKTRAENMGRTR